MVRSFVLGTLFLVATQVVPVPSTATQDVGGHHSADDERLDALTKEIGELRRQIVELQTATDNEQRLLNSMLEEQSQSHRDIIETLKRKK